MGHEWIKPGRDSCENFSSSGGYEEAVDVKSLVAFLHFRVGVMKEGEHFYVENIPKPIIFMTNINHVHKDVHNNWV